MTRMISPEIEAEFLRMPDAEKFSGLSRSTLYRLIAEGSLPSKVIRRPGNVQGIRLISKQALRDFINSCEDDVGNRPKSPPKKQLEKGGRPS